MDDFSTQAISCVQVWDVFEDVEEELGIGVDGDAVDGGAEVGGAGLL